MDKDFVFTVENMTREQAEELLDCIVSKVEEQGLQMGGGFHDADPEETGLDRVISAAKDLWFEIRWFFLEIGNGKEQ